MRRADIFLALLATFFWGSGFVAIQIGFDYFPPLLFVALRFILSAFPLILFVKRDDIEWKWILSIGLTLGVLFYGCWYIGMYLGMPAGMASLLLQTQVIFAALLALVLLKEIPTFQQKLGIGVALVGVTIIGSEISQGGDLVAFTVIMGGAFFWGVTHILMKSAKPKSQVRLMIWVSLVPPIPLLLLSSIFETGQISAIQNMGWEGFAVLIYTGLFGTIIAFSIWGRLLKTYSVAIVSPFSLLIPIFAMSLSALLLDETFSVVRVIGCITVFLGLIIVVMGKSIHSFIYKREKLRGEL